MKSNNVFWFGYIDTAKGKTLVVRNTLVDSNHKSSIFLYNTQRDALVEYSREIIEPKLIQANAGEYEADKLEKAYKRALREKRPNTYNLLYRSTRMKTSSAASNDETELVDDDDIETDDDDFNTGDFESDSDD